MYNNPNDRMLIYNPPTTAGWWFQSLWKMMEFVSWDDDIPNIWKNKKCSKPPFLTFPLRTTLVFDVARLGHLLFAKSGNENLWELFWSASQR